MDGVLEGAAVLCACKLACSLLFLPSLTASHSPISFCCCCLLIFTDFLVTVFLGSLYIFQPWLTQLAALGDVIALRFLLFLSHTYGVVLLLTTPLIAVEVLTRLRWPHRTVRQTAGSEGQRCYVVEVTVEEEEVEEEDTEQDSSLSCVVSYLCCLSVWIFVALNVRWRWRLEEVWAADCIQATDSLVRCLPNLFSPMPSALTPCWGMSFLSLLLFFIATSMGLHRSRRAPARTTHTQQHGVNSGSDGCWRGLDPTLPAPYAPVNAGMSASEAARRVDPEKTRSSCAAVHCAWMSARRHGDFGPNPPACLSAERGGQEQERTKRGVPLTFIAEHHVEPQYRSQCGWRRRGFPCPGVNAMIGFVGVLFIFVLPLNLSVNILLIRTIETVLQLCINSLLSPAASTSATETLV